MQHATLTPAPVAGIDWATDSNALCIIDSDGQIRTQLATPADAAGIRKLVQTLDRHGVTQVAIERPDGPVIDALLGAGQTVMVVTPRQVKHLRARYGQAGNKHDRFDAYVLADVLRTDRHRLTPLLPDTPQTLALRAVVRARADLVAARVAACNQLRAHLRVVFPAAVGLFADLDTPISLAFLTRFPSAPAAAWLTHRRLGAWLAAQGYCGRTPTRVLHDRLTTAAAGLAGEYGHAAAHATLASAPRSPPSTHSSPSNSRCTPTGRSSSPCPDPAASAPPSSWSRSATPAAASPPPTAWPRSPAPRPRPASPAATPRSASAGPATRSCARRSSTSPPTAATPAPGPKPSTSTTAHRARPTPTPPASSPAPGCASSGAAGKTTPPTTPPCTASPNTDASHWLDTGLLMPCGCRKTHPQTWTCSFASVAEARDDRQPWRCDCST